MKKNSITGVFTLLVFAVFMVCVLTILLTGADVVQSITQRDQRSYDQRTAVQYLTTRVRQADWAGGVSVSESGALLLREDIDGTSYDTSVYCHDGYLREMFYQTGYALPPEFGEEILPAVSFRASCEDQLLSVTLEMPDGTEETLFLRLRSEQEVAQ